MENFHTDSFLLGLEEAIEQILTEYDICKDEYNETDLLKIRNAFCRAIGLIEDTMICYGSEIKTGHYVDKL